MVLDIVLRMVFCCWILNVFGGQVCMTFLCFCEIGLPLHFWFLIQSGHGSRWMKVRLLQGRAELNLANLDWSAMTVYVKEWEKSRTYTVYTSEALSPDMDGNFAASASLCLRQPCIAHPHVLPCASAS